MKRKWMRVDSTEHSLHFVSGQLFGCGLVSSAHYTITSLPATVDQVSAQLGSCSNVFHHIAHRWTRLTSEEARL